MAAIDSEDDYVTVQTTFDSQGSPTVLIAGEIDLSTVNTVRAAIEAITRSEPDHIAFDLSGVGFMDSSGIAVLLEAAQQAQTVSVTRASPAARRVIETTGLSGVLHLAP